MATQTVYIVVIDNSIYIYIAHSIVSEGREQSVLFLHNGSYKDKSSLYK